MSGPTLAQTLASFAAETRAPDDVRSDVARRVLDTVGVALAAVPLDTSGAVIGRAKEQGGAPQAHAIGLDTPVPASAAAFVNGVLAHSLDFDDTHLPSILHPSATIVPACLAAAELGGATGAETVDAIAVGIELCVRLGMAGYDPAARQSVFFDRGQHATSICGAVAGAAAAARLLGLDADDIAHAIGIAVSMASGVIEGNRAGGTVKRLHCGIAAQSAVTAADLAARGVSGPPTALEGRFGFFEAFLGNRWDASRVLAGLGESWEVPRVFFKPYPANHFTHAGIDAALALRHDGLAAEDVEEIRLGVPTAVLRTIGEPLESKRRPATGYQAQFSGPFTVAAALLGGSGLGVGLEDFTDEAARDPARLALAARVLPHSHADCEGIYPYQFPSVVQVRTRTGRMLEHKVLTNRGGPERPLTDEELLIKFRGNAGRVLDAGAFTRIERAIAALDAGGSAAEALEPAGAAAADRKDATWLATTS